MSKSGEDPGNEHTNARTEHAGDISMPKKLWRRFRSLPPWAQIGSLVALLAIIIISSIAGGGNSSNNNNTAQAPTTSAPSPTETTSSPSPTEPSPSPTETSTATLSEWREQHTLAIRTVIANATNLVVAIDGANATRVELACDTLRNNYRDQLQPIPAPPDPVSDTWDLAKNNIFEAQRQCSGGVIRNPDLYQARSAAQEGANLLVKVGPA